MNRKRIRGLHFTITGEYITQISREMVLERNWRKGLSILMESLNGMTYEIAFTILSGRAELYGESDDGIDYRKRIDEDYMRRVKFHYGGLYQATPTMVIQPYGMVSEIKPGDYQDAIYEHGEENTDPFSKKDIWDPTIKRMFKYSHMSGDRGKQSHGACVAKYIDNKHEDFVVPIDYVDVLWKVVQDFPLFLKPHDDLMVAYDEHAEFGHLTEFGYVKFKCGIGTETTNKPYNEEQSHIAVATRLMNNYVLQSFKVPDAPAKPYTLEVDNEMTSPYGWIMPNGDWYNCGPMDHDRVALDIMKIETCKEDIRERTNRLGWVGIHFSIMGQGINFGLNRKLNQKQIDKIFDYCLKYNKKFPQEDIDYWRGNV